MKFSIRINNDLPVREYPPLAQAAENNGFDQFWISNDLFLRSAAVILAQVALATRKIEIGTCILNPYTVHPSEIAMFASTMDELSGNRFNLGLAAGAGEFLKWVGIDQTKPLTMMRETVGVIRKLLQGQHAELQGSLLKWGNEAYLRFKPARSTPIYLGAMSENMIALAAKSCNGILPLLFPPEHFHEVQALLSAAFLGETAIPQSAFDFAACIWVSIDADRSAARHELAKKIAYYGHALSPLIYTRLGVTRDDFRPIERALMVEQNERSAVALVNEKMLKIGVVGDADDLIGRLQPLIDAGARHLSFGPPLGPNPVHAIEYLGKNVLPRLKSHSGVRQPG